MARALRLAERGSLTTHPNPRVGCVVVRDGTVVGEGWHERAGEPHAEVHALRRAGERARGSDVFVNLEPCCHHGRTPPCTDALIAAGVRKVWVGMTDPNPQVAGQGLARLRAAGIEVVDGIAEAEARTLNRGFVSRMARRRPWVTLKLAASLDGRTAMASGESRWITGAEARADVHRLRARAGAVVTGVGTILADDPQLTARDVPGPVRQPDRIVLDSRARAPLSAQVWAEGARRFWVSSVTAQGCPAQVHAIRVPPATDGSLDLGAALAALAEHEVNEVLVECGSRLAGALLQQSLVDELVLYLAPSLLGQGARPLASLTGVERLDQKLRLEWIDVRRIGGDLRVTARPVTE